uniref:Ig-like domain-containing protein n=1 Tax=Oryzias latipes TaxID=8090 RepID=A0A3B3HPS2_ORYLA
TFEPNWSTFFVGESLTFKCDMKEGRKYDWTYTLKTRDWTPYPEPVSDFTLLKAFHISNKVSVTQKPSWSQIFRGERITLTCEVQGGEGVQWEYEWRTPQSQTFRTKQKDWTITASISGDYSCKSRPTEDSYSATKWSEALRLSVLGKNFSFSRIGTLTCSVNPSSSGWSYYFHRGEEVLTVQNTDFHSNREIRVSQGGVYRCRGGRGGPVYYSEFSDPVTIVLMLISDFLTISDFFDDPLTSSFKSDPYLIFAFTLYNAETIKCRRSEDYVAVFPHSADLFQTFVTAVVMEARRRRKEALPWALLRGCMGE